MKIDMAVIGPSKNTRPERLVRMFLVSLKVRHELHARWLPGSPDLFLHDHDLAVFVDGRFWHCPDSKARKISKFWRDKIDANVRRDRRSRRRLRAMGIRTVRVWDSDLKRPGWQARLRRLLGLPSAS